MQTEKYDLLKRKVSELLDLMNGLDFDILEDVDESYRLRSALSDCLVQHNRNTETDSEQDVVEPPVLTLRSLGYEDPYHTGEVFEKIIENTEEREVVLEVLPGMKMFRKRTIVWEKMPYGKRSLSVDYEPLAMTDEIYTAVVNMQKMI